tara:strand:+ start:260 stop:427 length:168 start_codon:yes stop_codon:yes gene_type:complete
MIEFFKHFFGLCGEHWHLNIWTVSSYSGIILFSGYVIKNKIYQIFNIKNNDTKRI